MSSNHWLMQRELEEDIMTTYITQVLEFAYCCFIAQGRPPTDGETAEVVAEVVGMIQRDIDGL